MGIVHPLRCENVNAGVLDAPRSLRKTGEAEGRSCRSLGPNSWLLGKEVKGVLRLGVGEVTVVGFESASEEA